MAYRKSKALGGVADVLYMTLRLQLLLCCPLFKPIFVSYCLTVILFMPPAVPCCCVPVLLRIVFAPRGRMENVAESSGRVFSGGIGVAASGGATLKP